MVVGSSSNRQTYSGSFGGATAPPLPGSAEVPPPLLADGQPDLSKFVLSTLPTPPPGFQIVKTMPALWTTTNASNSGPATFNASAGAQDAQRVGGLMNVSRDALMAQAHAQGCNAVLGMSVSVTNDSLQYGERGGFVAKSVFVTAYGTPCRIEPISSVWNGKTAEEVLVSDPLAVSGAETPIEIKLKMVKACPLCAPPALCAEHFSLQAELAPHFGSCPVAGGVQAGSADARGCCIAS